jgi:DNA repair protein RecN (Recombination protein N)
MLKELRIRDFALIEELSLELEPGLNVFTGETGAGKSIIIDALALLLGGKAQEEHLRTGANEAQIEGAFALPPDAAVKSLLDDEGIEQEEGEYLLLRRRILRQGANKAYVNGVMTPLGTLKTLGNYLVDIHGQHQHQSLSSPERHIDFLDAYAGLQDKVEQFKNLFRQHQKIAKEREELLQGEREKAQRMDLLSFQQQEIAAADLEAKEEEKLLEERKLLTHAEKLMAAAEEAYDLLEGDTSEFAGTPRGQAGNVVGMLAQIQNKIGEIVRIDERLNGIKELAESAAIQAKEMAAALRQYRDSLEFDPSRLEEVEARLAEIGKLKRKYGNTIAEILAYQQEINKELAALSHQEERLAELEKEEKELAQLLTTLSQELSSQRKKVAKTLEDKVQEELKYLGMPKTRFVVNFEDNPRLSPKGRDKTEFLISPNPGEEPKSLSKIASGGELSRIMLAMKTILAAVDQVPTLVFDEIDQGIGGGKAEIVGQKLCQVANNHQVLCITHLPQIASLADAHFVVAKRISGQRSLTQVDSLRDSERAPELERMLGGRGDTKVSLLHAEEILKRAEEYKRGMKSGKIRS